MEQRKYVSKLSINLNDLIQQRTVEGYRLEFKSTWDDQIKMSSIRSICAFANDLYNLNGGYIILGIEEQNGRPVLPPRGFDEASIDTIQKEITGACKGHISPEYLPLISVESFQNKIILIIRAPAGDNRPYEAPTRQGKGKSYYIRSGASTIEASGDLRRQLLEQTAKIPFDDRRSQAGMAEDISPNLVKKYLVDIRSHLASLEIDPEELCRSLRLVVPVNNHAAARNVALLFFHSDPMKFFPGARIEVVQFGDDAGGDLIEEKKFGGPLPEQIRSCLNYLEGLGGAKLQKIPGQAEVERTVPYPYEAMEEAIVNAVYHRSYESSPEPVKVYLYPDRMEITSYPGPVAGIMPEHLKQGSMPSVPARNRRIGEFLKDLRLAEARGTGIPKIKRKMQENGSPEAEFDFDDERTYFRVILPVHPRYQEIHALREATHLWVVGEKEKAIAHLERAFTSRSDSGTLASQLIEYAFGLERYDLARRVMEDFEKQPGGSDAPRPYLTMARLLIDKKESKEAEKILKHIPRMRTLNETIEAAILKKRTNDLQGAHRLFSEAYSFNADDPKIIQEFAQTKGKLARSLWKPKDRFVKKRLNQEAVELLRRAIQLTEDTTRKAWCWFDLARALDWLRDSTSVIEEAYLKARSLLPEEQRFETGYEEWKKKIKKHRH
ncbi:putative DNA binding domain-containing protein [bacterium]|nr:putative DNA binding domain-containing protein [bacterium]